MRDPEFAAAYRALEPELQIAREVIRLRLQQGLSQEELAQIAGTAQPNISRLERGTINPSLVSSQKRGVKHLCVAFPPPPIGVSHE